jgi:branched-chain amino acid transport system permease protein
MDLNVIVAGLTAGSLYALVAVGFNILYRPTGVLNFAQGDLVMLGAMISASALTVHALPWPVAIVLTLALVGSITVVEEQLAVAPILRRTRQGSAWIISTLAFSLIIANLSDRIWGPDPIDVPPPWPLSVRPMLFSAFTEPAMAKLCWRWLKTATQHSCAASIRTGSAVFRSFSEAR